jgi:hypothetical protein
VQGDRGKYSPTFPQEENRGIYSLQFHSRTGEYMPCIPSREEQGDIPLRSPRRGTGRYIPCIPQGEEQEDVCPITSFPHQENRKIYFYIPRRDERNLSRSFRRKTGNIFFYNPLGEEGEDILPIIPHVPSGGEQESIFLHPPGKEREGVCPIISRSLSRRTEKYIF